MTRARVMLAAKIVVSLVLAGLVVHLVPLGRVTRALASAEPLPLAAGMLLAPVYLWAAAAQQSLLLRGHRITLPAAGVFQLNLATGFYSLLMPGVLAGGAYRWYRLSAGGAQAVEALLFLVSSRIVELGALAILGLAAFALGRPPGAGLGTAVALGIAAAGLVVAVVAVADRRLVRLARSRLPDEPVNAVARSAGRALDALLSLGSMPRALVARMAMWLLMRHVVEVLSFALLAAAVGISLPALAVVWVRSFVVLAVMLPLSIAGIGVREAGLVMALAPYGVASEQALAFSLLLLGRMVVMGLVGGGVEAWRTLGAKRAEPLAQVVSADG